MSFQSLKFDQKVSGLICQGTDYSTVAINYANSSSNEELRLRTVIPSLRLLWLITGTKKEFVSFTNNSAYYNRLFDNMILQNTDKNALNNWDMPDKKQSLVRPPFFLHSSIYFTFNTLVVYLTKKLLGIIFINTTSNNLVFVIAWFQVVLGITTGTSKLYLKVIVLNYY